MGESSARKPADVLLVEDNPGDVRLIQEALKEGKAAINLHVVMDGEQAMQFLRQEGRHEGVPRPDLVLLDLNLPKKSGREVLAEIRCDEKLRMIPVVVLTTSKAEEDILRAYNLNCNCFITKPTDLEQFTQMVQLISTFWLTTVVLPPRA